MIRPKYICESCLHNGLCKFSEKFEQLLTEIDTKCQYYDIGVPMDCSGITCQYLLKRKEGVKNVQKKQF